MRATCSQEIASCCISTQTKSYPAPAMAQYVRGSTARTVPPIIGPPATSLRLAGFQISGARPSGSSKRVP